MQKMQRISHKPYHHRLFPSACHRTVFWTTCFSLYPSTLSQKIHFNIITLHTCTCIATRYGLDGPGIDSRWGRCFLYLSRPALGPNQPPIQWVPGISRG